VRELYMRAGVTFERLSVAIADESEWLDAGSPPGAGGAKETGQRQPEKENHDEGKNRAGDGGNDRNINIDGCILRWRFGGAGICG
jgi:hypothetical protein